MESRLYCWVGVVIWGIAACSSAPRGVAPVRSAANNYIGYNKGSYSGSTYVVKSGDTLYSIAWLTGSDFKILADLNNIKPPYLIYSGQSLKVRAIQGKKIQPNPARSNKSNSLSYQPAKHDSRHENTIDSNSSQRYRQNHAERSDIKSQTKQEKQNKLVQWLWPTKGKVSSRFSASRTGAKGIDILGRLGQPIKAAGNGKVVYAGSGLRGYGNLIIIKHSDDFLSAYAHNSQLKVKEGEWVKAGQLIANMGRTGTDSVKLRFEIREKGRPTNPLKYLPH